MLRCLLAAQKARMRSAIVFDTSRRRLFVLSAGLIEKFRANLARGTKAKVPHRRGMLVLLSYAFEGAIYYLCVGLLVLALFILHPPRSRYATTPPNELMTNFALALLGIVLLLLLLSIFYRLYFRYSDKYQDMIAEMELLLGSAPEPLEGSCIAHSIGADGGLHPPRIEVKDARLYGEYFEQSLAALSLRELDQILWAIEDAQSGRIPCSDALYCHHYQLYCEPYWMSVVCPTSNQLVSIVPTKELRVLLTKWRNYLASYEQDKSQRST